MDEEQHKNEEERRIARAFRLELQAAREKALADAEAFDGIIHVIERYGHRAVPDGIGIWDYKDYLCEVANHSALATEIPSSWRTLHQPFENLVTLVKEARNDAMHSGARARTLTTHTVELALILEDGLRSMEESKLISDFMIRNPVCAELWQPISFARQIMLTHSFSYLPIETADGWRLLSDRNLAKYLQSASSNKERKRRLAKSLTEFLAETGLEELPNPEPLEDNRSVQSVLGKLKEYPCLVFRHDAPDELVGILTPFDLL